MSISSPVLVTDLAPENIPQAFPLVQIAYRNVTRETWKRFALAHLATAHTGANDRFTNRGIVTARSATGYFLGLFAWKLETEPGHRKVVTCNHFVLPAVAGLSSPLSALLGRARTLAVFHQADMLVLHLPEEVEPGGLAEPGHPVDIIARKDPSSGGRYPRLHQPGADLSS